MLFNVKTDPHEVHNIAKDRPDLCAQGARLILEWQEDQMKKSDTDVDPMWTVMRENGPYHIWGELDGYRARDILVLIGTNDLGGENAAPEDVFAAVRKLVALIRIKQPDARLHLLAVLPRDVGGKETPRLWPERISAYNRLLQGLADGRRVFFHDIGARFLNAAGQLDAALFWDRLHPNPSGYDIWADEIERMRR